MQNKHKNDSLMFIAFDLQCIDNLLVYKIKIIRRKIFFLKPTRTQERQSLGYKTLYFWVCPIHLVGALQKVSDQPLILLSIESTQ